MPYHYGHGKDKKKERISLRKVKWAKEKKEDNGQSCIYYRNN